jgi:arylsulfatase A-like enzyme
MTYWHFKIFSLIVTSFALLSCGGGGSSGSSTGSAATPNILYVIMDDVGIDQMSSFGYGGPVPPSMPNIGAVASSGIRFRNTWSMPECSPGRAASFVGRYPLRTNTYSALGTYDLANAQMSPYDMTAPTMLKQANYESAMFGKFHLAGPDNNQAGNGTPLQLGWDYFYGWIRGGPAGLDTTAGGVAPTGTYSCGFVPSAVAGGADRGACYQPDNSCKVITGVNADGDVAGKQCMQSGGILVPNATCAATAPSGLNFTRASGYYVSPLVINSTQGGVQQIANTDSRSRGYRTIIETQSAIDWIKGRSPNKPWMATVSYSASHTPYQQPPGSLVKGGAGDDLSCTSLLQQKVIFNKMTEAADTEFGRLLVETGLAKRKLDGSLDYDPKASNTMIVIVGDNGSFANNVKSPFDLTRAKSTAYQTGVWVPLIVSGPMVVKPNRDVEHMTNMVDVFQLFGEIAGIDVPKVVPRTIDSAPLMPYLTSPNQASIRTVNFTQGSYNLQANGQRNGACLVSTMLGNAVLQTVCTQSIFDKGPCEDNAGVWWGPGYTDPSVITPAQYSGAPSSTNGYRTCWQVNQAQFKTNKPLTSIIAETTIAARNENYKLVRNTVQVYNSTTNTGGPVTTDEFYQIDQAAPTPKIDTADLDLMPTKSSWSSVILSNYNSLLISLNNILASQPACPGDANMDGKVNTEDLSIWQKLLSWALSSIADFNFDGLTNNADEQMIRSNTGTCSKATAVY